MSDSKSHERQNSGNPSTVHVRTDFERERDMARAAELYLQGHPQWRIGQIIGVSQSQISDDLGEIKNRWRESAIMDFNERKARELAKIDELERIAWDAYKKSCLPKKQLTRKRKSIIIGEDKDNEGTPASEIERTLRVEHQAPGNESFLGRVAWCIDRRCELLGIDAPRKTTLTDPTGTKPYSQLSDEQLEAIALGGLNKDKS